MRRTHTRIAGAIAALLAAAVAGFSLRPTPKATTVLAARPAEVKTQVIHRTIHIVRHKHAPARRVAPGAAGATGGGASGTSAPAHTVGAPVTGASRLSSASTSSGALTTRTSAGHGASPAGGSVTTRSSRAAGGAGSVTTRSSGGGERENGGDGGEGGD